MDSRNFMIITGNLGDNPVVKELKIQGKDKKVVEGSLAVTIKGREEPCWYNFEIWGETAAKLVGSLNKGDKLQVCGAFIYNEADDGKRYYKLIGESFELMTARKSS